MPLSSTNFEYSSNIPAFLSKLWTLVVDEKNTELIAWDPSGLSFHVFDQTRFAREILPRFFKHNNMASFIRQLNMYGFRKVNSIDHGSLRNEKEDMEFHHPYFIKDKEQFLEFIKRKVPDIKQQNLANGNQQMFVQQQQQQALQQHNQPQQQQQLTPHSNSQISIKQYPQIKPDEINKVLEDVSVIKTKQKLVDESLFAVKKENEALWKEIASLRQKHHHQQQIVNKLIHFLVHLVNPASMTNLKRSKPLMIDSHAAASFNDALYTDESNTAAVNSIGGDFMGLSKASGGNVKRRSFVEMDEDEESNGNDTGVEEALSPSAYTNIGVINKNELYSNCVEDSEIETINNIKSKNSGPATAAATKPSIKRLKSTDFQFMNGTKSHLIRNGNFQNYQIVNNQRAIVLNNGSNSNGYGSVSNVQVENSFNDVNLFVDSERSGGGSAGNLIDSMSMMNDSVQPIVSMPDSPSISSAGLSSGNSRSSSRITLFNDNNLTSVSGQNSNNESSDENTIIAENAQLKRTISNYKAANSPANMSEHIESLQIDLNSIKEFLTNSTFNQPDTYNTINSLFSPNCNSIILDQIDENSYLDAPSNPGQYNTSNNQLVNNSSNSNSFIQNDLANSMISNDKVIDFNQLQEK